jgi:hypothetical protein
MVLGDSVESKSFDCTLAENRTDSSSAFWEVPSESADEFVFVGTFRDLLESRGTFPADTLDEVEIPWEVDTEETVDFREVAPDSSLPKDFASSRK